MRNLLAVIAVAVLVGFAAQPADAAVSGSLWLVPDPIAADAIPANVPATTADVTFSVNAPLNFYGAFGTVGAFLTSGGAFGIIENTPGTLASPISDSITGTIIEFTGSVSVSSGQTFTVTHDDGLTLTIGALTVIDEPGSTGPVTETFIYGGPAGTYAFQLVYGECGSGEAVLKIDLDLPSTAVPLPAALPLLVTGLAGLGFAGRRARKAA